MPDITFTSMPLTTGLASLATGVGTFYTATSKTLVKEMLVTNTATGTCYYDIFFVPSGQSVSDQFAYFHNSEILQNETHILSLNTVLAQGDFISAGVLSTPPSGGYVNLKISGIQIQ